MAHSNLRVIVENGTPLILSGEQVTKSEKSLGYIFEQLFSFYSNYLLVLLTLFSKFLIEVNYK